MTKKAIRKVTRSLRSCRGSAYIFTCIVIMAAAMFMSLLWLYTSCINIVRGNKTFVGQKLDAYLSKYMVEHADLMVYGDEIYSRIDSEELKKGALKFIGAEDGKEVTTSSGAVMKNCTAEYVSGEQFGVRVSYELLIPVSFLGQDFGKMKVPVKVRSRVIFKN